MAKRKKVVDPIDKTEVRTAASQEAEIDVTRLMHHVNQVKGYNGKISSLTGHRRKQLEVAKNEGFSGKAISHLILMEKQDPLEFRDYLRQLGAGMKEMGQPFQLSVFDTAYGSPVEQARAEAKAAASAGRGAECRWPEGSPEHEAYTQTYAEIQASMVPGAEKLSQGEIGEAVTGGRQAAA